MSRSKAEEISSRIYDTLRQLAERRTCEVEPHRTFTELNMDSIDVIEVFMCLSLDLDMELDDDQLTPESTVQDLIDSVLDQAGYSRAVAQSL